MLQFTRSYIRSVFPRVYQTLHFPPSVWGGGGVGGNRLDSVSTLRDKLAVSVHKPCFKKK